MLRNELAIEALLFGDAAGRVNHAQVEFVHQAVVLVEHLALEHAKAFDEIVAPPHVHAGFVEFQLHAAGEQAVDRHVHRHPKVHREIRPDREAVQLANPLAVDTAGGIARERRVGIAVGEHDHAGLERRNDVVEQPVGEVGRVQQAERHRRQRVLLLAALGRRLDQRRRIPLGDDDAVAGGAKPFRQEPQLRRFSGPVDALHDEELSRILVRCRESVQHAAVVRVPAGSGPASLAAASGELESNRFPEHLFERLHVPVRRPQLELGIPRGAQSRKVGLGLRIQVDGRHRLCVTAVEPLGQTDHGRQPFHRPPQLRRKRAVALVRLLRQRLAVIARDERNDLGLLRLEAAQAAVLDQVIGVAMMPLVTDVDADVVQQRAVFEPLAFAVAEPVRGAALVEDTERQPCDLLRVFRPEAAAFARAR